MKTQTSGRHTAQHHPCQPWPDICRDYLELDCLSFISFDRGAARCDYKEKRENGLDSDAPTSRQLKFDGHETWIDGQVEGNRVYGVKKGGYIVYNLRYDEGPGDRAYMEERDKNYLTRILRGGALRQQEPAVWYLREQDRLRGDPDAAQDGRIGEWWSKKLQLPNITALLERAEQDYQQFVARETQERAAREAQERASREAREAREKQEREEREAREHAAREAQERTRQEQIGRLQSLQNAAQKLLTPLQTANQLQLLPQDERQSLQSLIDYNSSLKPASLDEGNLTKAITYFESRQSYLSSLPQKLAPLIAEVAKQAELVRLRDRLQTLASETSKILQPIQSDQIQLLPQSEKTELQAFIDCVNKLTPSTLDKENKEILTKIIAQLENKQQYLSALPERMVKLAAERAKEIATLRKEIHDLDLSAQAALEFKDKEYKIAAVKNYKEIIECYEKLNALGMDCKKLIEETEARIKEIVSKSSPQVTPQPQLTTPSSSSTTPPQTPPIPAPSTTSSTTLPQTPLTFKRIPFQEIRLGEELGQGGFGIVYKATWQQEPIAVKRLHMLKLTDDSAVEFENETETMSKLDHPRIVHLFGICAPPDPYCLVMEYLPRGSLYSVLHSKQKYPWSISLQIGFDIGCGLALLHQARIVHRDLKSANVLLDDHFRAKITDFGLSRTRQEVSTISTKTVVGTPTWKAPETFGIRPKYSSASDVYAYGIILWEIVTRKDPYEGADANEIGKAVQQGDRETIPTTCSPSYAELITRCWEQRAEDRPEAKVVAERLEIQIQDAQRAEIKPWYCDPSVKPTGDQGEQYYLIDAPESDKRKVISFYQHHAVNGMDIKSVKIIYNLEFNRAFAAKMVALQGRHNNPGFIPKWSQENDPQWRGEIMKRLEQMISACQDPDFPNVKIIAMWHGTRPQILDSVFRTGYASLATTDPGFYGQGIYSTYEAEYAYRVYSKGALLVNWVAFYSAYPVIDGDMPKFVASTATGEMLISGHYQNYDAHFIPVRPASSSPSEMNYLPCRTNEPARYHELVVFEAAQCLPRYIVELQPSLPLAPVTPAFPVPAPSTTAPPIASMAGNPLGMFGGKKKGEEKEEKKTIFGAPSTPQ